jgi:hypothetical protein
MVQHSARASSPAPREDSQKQKHCSHCKVSGAHPIAAVLEDESNSDDPGDPNDHADFKRGKDRFNPPVSGDGLHHS